MKSSVFQLHAQFTQILKSSKIFLGSLSKTLDEEVAEMCRNSYLESCVMRATTRQKTRTSLSSSGCMMRIPVKSR